jgi:hypothetical protein
MRALAGKRVKLGVLLAITLWIIWALWMAARGEPRPSPPAPSPYDARILALDRQALDEAYDRQIRQLFLTWMKDEHGQPARAMTGAARARRAYIAVMHEIEAREQRQREIEVREQRQ